MKIVYICSPYLGDIETNVFNAREYCRYAIEQGCTPVAPHLLYPQILDDSIPEERTLGIQMGLKLLDACDELWICGEIISTGMMQEIEYAESIGKTRQYIQVEEPGLQMHQM